MLDAIRYVLGEIQVIKTAPVAFAACVAASVAIAWVAMRWRYSGVISNKEAELVLVKAERDDYRQNWTVRLQTKRRRRSRIFKSLSDGRLAILGVR